MIAAAPAITDDGEEAAALRLKQHSDVYARLKADITAAGIMRRSYAFYFALIAFSFAGYGLSLWAVVAWSAVAPLLLACIGVTFFTTQLAGLMHDGGHRAAFSSKLANDILGVAATAAIGMVLASWTERHNRHHARPNQHGADPDMEVPFLALTRSNFEEKDAAQRFSIRWQAFYYYPLGSLVGFSNRLGSITYFLSHRSFANFLRFVIYLPAIVVLFAGPFIFFPLDKAIFVFLVVHITTGVYLASCFAPNHKGMATFPPDAKVSFLEQQVVTARNVSGGFLTDLFLVGLNHQIEHHLFPNCPRNKLALVRPYVHQACLEQGIDYCDVSFISTNRTLVHHLHDVSRTGGSAV